MTKKHLSHISKQLLKFIEECEGLEVVDTSAHIFRELEDAGLIDWSAWHGPGMKWRRVTVR